MKKGVQFFKDILPALILSLTTSFMFLIFEPISLYANNINDFWFDLYDISPLLIIFFLISTIIIFIILFLCYLLLVKFLKKKTLYYIILSISFCIFLITYIQGNFLSGSLPGVNGEVFNWREYKIDSIISVALWIIVFLASFFIIKKVKLKKFVSFISPITGAIFFMLLVSFASSLLTTNALEDKFTSKATFDYYNQVSKNRNFFIFLVDAIDSRSFDNLLKDDPDYKETFKDFTYYQDTTSYYPYTRDSIPYIFSQIPNHNETDFDDYSKKAFGNSNIIKTLNENNYNMYFYDDEYIMGEDTASIFKNITSDIKIKKRSFLSEIMRYDYYKYLPYPLKGKAHIEELNFQQTGYEEGKTAFDWGDKISYDIYKNEGLELVDENVFHYIHLEGGHVWFSLDENVNPIEPGTGTYSQKQTATFKVIKAYLDRLKSAGAYDNASIVILSDHGYDKYDVNKRFNPILYIKGVGETHSKTHRSNKPISFEDLGDAFIDLYNKKSSTELFNNIESPRDRNIIYYIWTKEDHMIEKVQTGKAWDETTIKETGNVFDR